MGCCTSAAKYDRPVTRIHGSVSDPTVSEAVNAAVQAALKDAQQGNGSGQATRLVINTHVLSSRAGSSKASGVLAEAVAAAVSEAQAGAGSQQSGGGGAADTTDAVLRAIRQAGVGSGSKSVVVEVDVKEPVRVTTTQRTTLYCCGSCRVAVPQLLVLMPCGHRAACPSCAERLSCKQRPCPVCRRRVVGVQN